ncbi:hypothetical protein GPK96_09090 [Blautia sp. MCC289]|nr:hypothetical protein [Blautia sp. MCC289]
MESKSTGILLILPVKNLKFQNRKFKKKWGKMIYGYPVDIEIKTLEGQPAISIIGLGDLAVKEAAERIQAAIDESGFVFPKNELSSALHQAIKRKVVHTLIWQWLSAF